jgi:ATP-dependent helicase/nuclease subunit B
MVVPRVFNIPASAPFLRVLVEALVGGRLVPGLSLAGDPLALAGATLYLPTRRACRLARDVFLEVIEGDAAILPRIVPLGDIDEDDFAFAETGPGAAEGMALAPTLGGLDRRLLLAELVLKWATSSDVQGKAGAPLVANNPAAALALADELARLMDDMTTRQVAWEKLDGLVPDRVDVYWQLTLDFLKIARQAWPLMLAERGAIEPAARRDLLIAAETERLTRCDGPIVAAGSTGSMPATAALLATIATLPHGAVVLPGLDLQLDEDSWSLIGGRVSADGRELTPPSIGHPQFALHGLLRRLGLARDGVVPLHPGHARDRLVSEALRPAQATEHWQARRTTPTFQDALAGALADVSVVEAVNAEEEALAIAVALRESTQMQASAALITPDRALARRVLAALARWNIPVDDTGGDALADTPAGVFARLAAEVALGGLAPVPLLALIKHARFRLDAAPDTHARAIAVLEQAILRGPRPRPGSAGLRHAFDTFRADRASLHRSDPRRRLTEPELDAAAELVTRLTAALAPLERLPRTPLPLARIAECHRAVIAALSFEDDAEAAFAGHDGATLAMHFDELQQSPAARGLALAIADYPDLFRTSAADRAVRRPDRTDARVRIYGPLEARLQEVTRVVLGGLVEGTWPPEPRIDPWLSRPMRHALGLDLPERRIGLAAHDFAQALGAKEVILTRAAKLGGAPTVASRFVQRLAAVAGEAAWSEACGRGRRYLDWSRKLDAPERTIRMKAPAPRPPRAARPTQLSVTDIEHWLRDPYTIYAKYVLRLPELEAVDTPPGAADRGTVIHGAIGDFAQAYAAALPPDPLGALTALGRKHFTPLEDYPEARAFWWPRFLRIARWFVEFETVRRAGLATLNAETRGKLPIRVGERTLLLTARADRIERLADGRYAILDYKTGSARTEKQVRTGLAPQLTLEAAMLRAGGFEGIAAGSVASLGYVTLKGVDPPGEDKPIEFKEGTPDSHADQALARLTALAIRFEKPETPYRSLVHPMWKNHYGTYDHLARVKEWSLTGGETDDIP